MMADERYGNKKKLVSYELNVKLFENYDFEIDDAYPFADHFIIHTDKGEKILKIEKDTRNVEAMESISSYIKRKFDGICSLIKNKNGGTFVSSGENFYFIFDMPQGRGSNFTNPSDLEIISKNLAAFHEAALGFNDINAAEDIYGKLIENTITKLKKMKICKVIAEAHKNKSDFDKIFLDKFNFYENEFNYSIEELNKADYLNFTRTRGDKYICHHDLIHNNIIINDDNGKVFFMGIEKAVIDTRIHDLCNFINKIIYSPLMEADNIIKILKDYNSISFISKEELKILYAMLNIPENFYIVAAEYYLRWEEWPEETFLGKISRIVDSEENRQKKLKEIKTFF